LSPRKLVNSKLNPPAAQAGCSAASPNSLGAASPAGILPRHWRELQASAIAADVAALNIASFGPGTDRHWEDARADLIWHARQPILFGEAPGKRSLSGKLRHLDRRYENLAAGGWRSLGATLPGLPTFDQLKPDQPRHKGQHDQHGHWQRKLRRDGSPDWLKYESPPGFPDGGGLLLPHVPDRCWRSICARQGLPFPDPSTRAAGFWPWALATAELEILICEGWKKALAAISAGWAAVAVPGTTMGVRRPDPSADRRLIGALQQLAASGRRPWRVAFDADRKPETARQVGAAAGALAQALRAAGGRVEIARIPLLPGTDKTGLDDLLAAAGPEALDRALADVGPRAVLPRLTGADQIAPAGAWLGDAARVPSPAEAPLLLIAAPMGCGKTTAVSAAITPLQAAGIPILLPSHRQALGRAAAASIGVPWEPDPESDDRQQGVAACLDSWSPAGRLRVGGDAWPGAVMVLDEAMQQLEHLLLSQGTMLGSGRRAAVLRTLAQQLRSCSQVIAMDAQLADPARRLLETLTGRRAHLIRSEHQPMAGRRLYAPSLKSPAAGFRAKVSELTDAAQAGSSLLVWTSAQDARANNAAQTLAQWHRQRRPNDLIDVVDSSTPELAAELAADPDGWAERRIAAAKAAGVAWALYASPAVSSGLSWQRWRPTAVVAFSGGCIAPEHVAQAMARVRSADVPVYLYAPERSPGGALRRVGSGSTDAEQLIDDLQRTADPLLGALLGADDDGAWLRCWAELGAARNRQRHAHRATIAGLLGQDGWQLQTADGDAEPCPTAAAEVQAELAAITDAAGAAEDAAIIAADPLTAAEAVALKRCRRLDPAERAQLQRHDLAQRWALGGNAPSAELIAADRDGLAEQLRMGWILQDPDALAMVPDADRAAIAALDPAGRPFAPDRIHAALGLRLLALRALGIPGLIQRFAAGETIAATDAAIQALHDNAVACRGQLATAISVSPGRLATGTLRSLLRGVGWRLRPAGRIKQRGAQRDTLTYTAEPVAMPAGVDAAALQAAWRSQLQAAAKVGAEISHTETRMGDFCPSTPPPPPPAPPAPPAPPPLPPRWLRRLAEAPGKAHIPRRKRAGDDPPTGFDATAGWTWAPIGCAEPARPPAVRVSVLSTDQQPAPTRCSAVDLGHWTGFGQPAAP
jgi:hypothetical protein